MDRTAIEGRRVAAEGAAVGGATVEASTGRAGVITLVSMVKFLRLLNMHPVEGRKNTRTVVANVSRNRNPKIVRWQVRD